MPRAYMFGCVMKLGRLLVDVPSTRLSRRDLLFIGPVGESHDRYAFHEASDRVTQEFTPWFERPVYTDMLIRGHEEVA